MVCSLIFLPLLQPLLQVSLRRSPRHGRVLRPLLDELLNQFSVAALTEAFVYGVFQALAEPADQHRIQKLLQFTLGVHGAPATSDGARIARSRDTSLARR